MSDVDQYLHGRHRGRSKVRRRLLVLAIVGLAAVTGLGTVAALSAAAPTDDARGEAVPSTSGQAQHGGSLAPAAAPTATPTPATTAAPKAAGTCARPAGAKPVVKVTEVKVGVHVSGYGQEGDTDPLPMAIAATPSGGSWLAWLGTNGRVYLGKLDCDDKLVGKPTSFTGIDLQDVHADSNGGVLLLTRRGSCGSGPLCGGSSSPCNTMHMIRFDNAGKQVWERQVTNLGGGREGYDEGARFIWWYQHHGRLASDGKSYAAYFGVAITVRNGNCVDIHEGDRLQVVNANGTLAKGHRDSFEVGCSHSWTARAPGRRTRPSTPRPGRAIHTWSPTAAAACCWPGGRAPPWPPRCTTRAAARPWAVRSRSTCATTTTRQSRPTPTGVPPARPPAAATRRSASPG